MFSVQPCEDTLLAGKYPVRTGETIWNFLSKSHRDPDVYTDPDEFKPERMLDMNFKKLPKNAWKPFGNGVRAVSSTYIIPWSQTGGVWSVWAVAHRWRMDMGKYEHRTLTPL